MTTDTSVGGRCLLCGVNSDLTVEHIVPQTLWRRFGLDPNADDLARFRTTLCRRHNQATADLHQREEMLRLIETGEPVTRMTVAHLADWATWITLILGLARGSGVLGEVTSRSWLLRRFDGQAGGPPPGVRVYAAHVSQYVDPGKPAVIPHAVALQDDARVLLDPRGRPVGFSVDEGPVNASESIGLGKFALLVLGRSWSSGEGHEARLDDAATSVGLERIHPTPDTLPGLEPRTVSMTDVGRVFTVVPFGPNTSLLPEGLRALAGLLGADGFTSEDAPGKPGPTD